MNDVISFSLYGADPLYCAGAALNVDLAATYYPGWRCRFYLDDSVPAAAVEALEGRGVEIVRCARAGAPMYGRYWRYLVAADPAVGRFLVRDTDSRLNVRERAAVDAWIASGKSFHLMRDSADHRTRALGGMWGGIGGKIPDMQTRIDEWGQYDTQGQSDRFVSEVVVPLMGDDYLCHDNPKYFDDGQPFPPHGPMTGTSFVGEVVTFDDHAVDPWRRAAEYRDLYIRARDLAARRLQDVADLCANRDVLAAVLRDLHHPGVCLAAGVTLPIEFSAGSAGAALLLYGFSDPESWGCWTVGSRAAFVLPGAPIDTAAGEPTVVELDCLFFVQPECHPECRFTVQIDDGPATSCAETAWEGTLRLIRPPRHRMSDGAFNVVHLHIENAASPKSLGLGDDQRGLGIGVRAARSVAASGI